MTRSGFAKILRSQESGWSGDRPNQRGSYILVPKVSLGSFPKLSKLVLNDQSVIKCVTLDGSLIGLNIVYHNAKYFPETHARGHDEVRIYRNRDIDEALGLDKNVLVVFLPLDDDNTYVVFSLTDEDDEFGYWKKFNSKPFSLADVSTSSYAKKAAQILENQRQVGSVQNFEELAKAVQTVSKKATNSRGQQAAATNDPGRVLSSLISNQPEFAEYLQQMYNYKCSVRKQTLIDTKSCIGLEAAHIMSHADGGPLLPTNGILLSADLHRAFDRGAITLTIEKKVEVNSKVPKSSEIWNFNDTLISPLPDFEIFGPFPSYIEHHRNSVFAKFRT